MNDHDALREAYDRCADTYGKVRNRRYDKFRNASLGWFAEEVRQVGDRVLDLGSGPGHEALLIKGKGLDPLAIDFSPRMVRNCRECGVEALQMDLYDLHLPEAEFAGAWASFSLLHLPKKDMSVVLSEIRRALRPGGVVAVLLFEGSGEGPRHEDYEKFGVARYFSYYRPAELKTVIGRQFTIIREDRLAGSPRPRCSSPVGAITETTSNQEESPLNANTYENILGQYRRGCVFCDPNPQLLLASTEHFGVCFDAAPLTPGHLIIFSREHYGCAGEVPPELLGELTALRTEIKDRIRDRWGSVTLYEHGRVGHCLSDGPEHRLCHHFHLHCVPGDIDVADELVSRFDHLPVTDYADLPEIYADHGDYLYLETDAGKMSYLVVNEEIERHLLRTLISAKSGYPDRADWRKYTDYSVLEEGMAVLGHSPTSVGS
ncbi:methyltransferase domain-containing protein [Micromonospora sp. LOL_021]|uniref:methyltransferase domain-containing protein n=1 Tax=Micromonospora sp. LOL_021 TaxID=3345417 RepID=UPI003A89029C